MSGKPDMTIHTLTHFLDRFVYRTPKASAATRGSSIMQPLAGSDAKDRLVSSGKHAHHLPLNSEAFWQKKSEEVAAEDVFFHEYFNRLGKDKEKARKKKGQETGGKDGEDDELSDAESEIWQALVDSRPEVEGGDSDDDLDMDDLESAYDKSDEEEGAGSGDEGVIINDQSDEDEDMDEGEEEPAAAKPKAQPKSKDDAEEDEDDDFDMDVSDEEAFVDSDEEVPSDVELGTVDELPKDEKHAEKQKRRKLKHLPTFASADDYAALLAGEDEGM